MTKPAHPSAPVVCIGNATLGGVGKTPFAIALFTLLKNEGVDSCFLTRGYGGREAGPLKANAGRHDAGAVGDEALLLAKYGPVWVSKNRAAGAQAAARDGAQCIIMDDGLQNPTLAKAFSILLIDAKDPSGNDRIFPAGPLREPLARAKARADITVAVGANEDEAERGAEISGADFAAWLEPCDSPPPQKIIAFSGIGRPEKFFAGLRRAGFDIAECISFPDHHPFTAHNLAALKKLAAQYKAALVTTEKDHVRLPEDMRDVLVFPVRMRINRPTLLTNAILAAIEQAKDRHTA